MPKTKKADGKVPPKQSRPFIRQANIPSASLEAAVKVAEALHSQFGGKAPAHRLADAVGMTQTSSTWRYLSGAALAYGLTTGAYNAPGEIELGDIGRRIVAPRSEGDDTAARAEAALKPAVLQSFMTKYNGNNFPDAKYGINVLLDLGVPAERASDVFKMIEANGRYAGILQPTRTGRLYVSATPAPPVDEDSDDEEVLEPPSKEIVDAGVAAAEIAHLAVPIKKEDGVANNRVFITHGKNKAVVEQLKKITTYGKLVPIVAAERETTSIPVPEKVFDDMRSCFAGIIHVAVDETIVDAEGKQYPRINENVLIEIGAAMALYRKNVILLAQKGLKLPSNLQGLYLCLYEGDGLDGDATMKLLEALNGFTPS